LKLVFDIQIGVSNVVGFVKLVLIIRFLTMAGDGAKEDKILLT
jgi:hypothetical protein